MKIDSLQIIHIYEYKKEKGERSPIDVFIRDINPIKLSTCMRQIYLFDHQQTVKSVALQKLIDDLENAPASRKCRFDHLQGSAAYSFILYWLMGGINQKTPFADDRLLGQFRDIVTQYNTSKSLKEHNAYLKHQKILEALLFDTKHLHLILLENKLLPQIEKEKLFKIACDNCASRRHDGTLENLPKFDYRKFFLNPIEINREFILQIENLQLKLNESIAKFESKQKGKQPIPKDVFFSPAERILRKAKSLNDLKTRLEISQKIAIRASIG